MSAGPPLQTTHDERPWTFVFGLGLSVLLHVCVAALLVRTGMALNDSKNMADAELFEPPKSNVLELGEPDSDATTITWIGYTEYEEHLAPKHETEQALASTESAPGLAQEISPISPDEGKSDDANESEPAIALIDSAPTVADEAKESTESRDTPTELASAPEPTDTVLTAPPMDEPSLDAPILVAQGDAWAESEFVGPIPTETAKEAKTPEQITIQPDPEPQETPTTEKPTTQIPPTSTQEITPVVNRKETHAPPVNEQGNIQSQPVAVPTDREAVATAIKESTKYDPGKPLASKGLRIQTSSPEISHYNALYARYRNPVARIFFGRDGKVKDVVLLRDSGHADIDRILSSASRFRHVQGDRLEDQAKIANRNLFFEQSLEHFR